ncbi:MAG: alpha/beta hydrolase [Saprospiraceae bacterium]|nr:alpha/beta hydrolase [Saprospiraceae bacterium]
MKSQMLHFPHFYIYDSGTLDAQNPSYEFGDYDIVKDKLIKARQTKDKATFLTSVIDSISSLDKTRAGLIIYIHGFQGDNKQFVQSSGYILQKEVFDQASSPYGMAISLQWKSPMSYNDAVKTARSKGQTSATILHQIYSAWKKSHPEAPLTIICHSMGNRVWQGLYESWITLDHDLSITNVLIMAADLETDVLTTSFKDIQLHCHHLYIYHSLADRTLQMANALNEHKRLGIYGPIIDTSSNTNSVHLQAQNTVLPIYTHEVIIRDVTKIQDDETFAGKLSKHRYYYGSPTIRKEIVGILINNN